MKFLEANDLLEEEEKYLMEHASIVNKSQEIDTLMILDMPSKMSLRWWKFDL